MNKAERQELILNKLKVDHHVYISDLCQELDTSYDSIRRDITELDAAGKLKRVHGGAIAKGGLPLEYVNRSDLESNAKQQLAHKAIELFHDGDILLIDGGTSNVELVRQLPSDMHFTIFTNSLPVATEFCDLKNLEIHLLGGTVFAQSRITIGATVAGHCKLSMLTGTVLAFVPLTLMTALRISIMRIASSSGQWLRHRANASSWPTAAN